VNLKYQFILLISLTGLWGQSDFPGLDAYYHTQTLATVGSGEMLVTGISEFTNPALLPNLKDRFRLSWVHYPAGITAESVVFNQRRSRFSFGLGVKHLGYGIFKGKDENNNPTEDYTSGDLQVIVTLARAFSGDRGSIGVTTGIFTSRLERTRAAVIQFTPGAIINLKQIGGRVGIRYTGLGAVLSSYTDRKNHLPRYLILSYGAQLTHLPLELAFDIRKVEGANRLNGGVSGIFMVNDAIRIKGGFSPSRQAGVEQDLFNRSGVGVEFDTGKLVIDLGFFLYQPGSGVFSLGLAMNY
jgi:hypothetical protein